jgi:hypothetical protein
MTPAHSLPPPPPSCLWTHVVARVLTVRFANHDSHALFASPLRATCPTHAGQNIVHSSLHCSHFIQTVPPMALSLCMKRRVLHPYREANRTTSVKLHILNLSTCGTRCFQLESSHGRHVSIKLSKCMVTLVSQLHDLHTEFRVHENLIETQPEDKPQTKDSTYTVMSPTNKKFEDTKTRISRFLKDTHPSSFQR